MSLGVTKKLRMFHTFLHGILTFSLLSHFSIAGGSLSGSSCDGTVGAGDGSGGVLMVAAETAAAELARVEAAQQQAEEEDARRAGPDGEERWGCRHCLVVVPGRFGSSLVGDVRPSDLLGLLLQPALCLLLLKDNGGYLRGAFLRIGPHLQPTSMLTYDGFVP